MQQDVLDKVKSEISQLEVSSDVEERQRAFSAIKHSFLSILADGGDHHELKEHLQRLNLMDPGSHEWMKVFKEFRNYVFNHLMPDGGLVH